jgi:hypothetical protein
METGRGRAISMGKKEREMSYVHLKMKSWKSLKQPGSDFPAEFRNEGRKPGEIYRKKRRK